MNIYVPFYGNKCESPTIAVAAMTFRQNQSLSRNFSHNRAWTVWTVFVTLALLVCMNSYFLSTRIDCTPTNTFQGPMAQLGKKEELRGRNVDFLQFSASYSKVNNDPEKSAEANMRDAFSASWWQSTSSFVSLSAFENMKESPEGASFTVFEARVGHVRMTRDWLDLSVEHMSKWWKVIVGQKKLDISKEEGILIQSMEERIVDIFKTYIYSNDRVAIFNSLNPTDAVTKSTIVVIAYMPDPSQIGIWSLAATLMSFIQSGMGRIVVSGNQASDEEHVQKAFSIVANATSPNRWRNDHVSQQQQPWTQLQFCKSADASSGKEGKGVNIPQAVLKQLGQVFQKEMVADANIPEVALKQLRIEMEEKTPETVSQCWLGIDSGPGSKRHKKWKYVFLAEPDLLLVMKPNALSGLRRELEKGGVLAPHRLQPLPHASDFESVEGIDNFELTAAHLIPNVPPFENVAEIDILSTTNQDYDSCCDRGTYKPSLLHPTCGDFWWRCGYNKMLTNPEISSEAIEQGLSSIMVAHKRLMGYSLMRLKQGTGVVYASAEHGKTCSPKIGLCTRWKRRQTND